MSDDLLDPGQYGGTARLFPLPNLVLFPRVVQPLHVFEPRYRQMTADALAGDRLIAMALLRPGWEPDYEGRPAIHPVACLARVVAEERLEDGRYNLLVRGVCRLRVVEELDSDRLYRVARADLLPDEPVTDLDAARQLRQALAERVLARAEGQPQVAEHFDKLVHSDLPLGALCDIFSFALPLAVELRQMLLEERDVRQRAGLLLAQLGAPAAPAARFPPDFSVN